jgi:hypothetical protein
MNELYTHVQYVVFVFHVLVLKVLTMYYEPLVVVMLKK